MTSVPPSVLFIYFFVGDHYYNFMRQKLYSFANSSFAGRKIPSASEGSATHSYFYLRSSRVQAGKTSLRRALRSASCEAASVSTAHAQNCAGTIRGMLGIHINYAMINHPALYIANKIAVGSQLAICMYD